MAITGVPWRHPEAMTVHFCGSHRDGLSAQPQIDVDEGLQGRCRAWKSGKSMEIWKHNEHWTLSNPRLPGYLATCSPNKETSLISDIVRHIKQLGASARQTFREIVMCVCVWLWKCNTMHMHASEREREGDMPEPIPLKLREITKCKYTRRCQ